MYCLECDDKICKRNGICMYDKIVIGIDQSYKDTGVSVACDGSLKHIDHIRLSIFENNSERRRELSRALRKVLSKCIGKSKNIVVICERIRLRSEGFINIDYIKSIGALNATIVDIAREFGINVYSVDTRSWKSQVVGTSKAKNNKYGVDPKKWPTICYVKKLGFLNKILEPAGKRKKAVIEIDGEKYFINDNAADSACIALYGFLPEADQKLEEEH